MIEKDLFRNWLGFVSKIFLVKLIKFLFKNLLFGVWKVFCIDKGKSILIKILKFIICLFLNF